MFAGWAKTRISGADADAAMISYSPSPLRSTKRGGGGWSSTPCRVAGSSYRGAFPPGSRGRYHARSNVTKPSERVP